MTYLSVNNKKREKRVQYGIVVFFFSALLLLFFFFKEPLYRFFEPVVLVLSKTKNTFFVFPEYLKVFVTSQHALLSKQKELEIVVENLENSLAEKNSTIRELLLQQNEKDTTKLSQPVPLVAYPLFKDITSLYSTVILSKGFKDNVTNGDIVFLRGRQVVCTIESVSAESSLCKLISASGVITEAVSSSSTISLSLEGKGGFFLGSLPRGTSISVGEVIYLKSDPSFVIGTVTEVLSRNQETSEYVYVKGAYNPITSAIFYVQKNR